MWLCRWWARPLCREPYGQKYNLHEPEGQEQGLVFLCNDGTCWRVDVVPVIWLFIHLDKSPERILDINIRVWVFCFANKCPDHHTFRNAYAFWFCPVWRALLCSVTKSREARALTTSRLCFLLVDLEEAARRCCLQHTSWRRKWPWFPTSYSTTLTLSTLLTPKKGLSPSLQGPTVGFLSSEQDTVLWVQTVCIHMCVWVCMYIYENTHKGVFLRLNSVEEQGLRPSIVLSVS